MKWFKKLFNKLSSKSSQPTLQDKLVEMYGEEAGEANMGIPIGGFLETAMFVYMIEDARKALEE